MELLEFAHCYSIAPLIDICTNMISLIAKDSDHEAILELGERLSNEHLKTLAAHLKTVK